MEEALQVFGPFDQRLTVVREWKRNHPPPGDPAVHPTENNSIAQLGTRRSRCVSDGHVPICTPKRLEPARCMKHSGSRMSLSKPRPSWIPKRIDAIGYRHLVLSLFSSAQVVSRKVDLSL